MKKLTHLFHQGESFVGIKIVPRWFCTQLNFLYLTRLISLRSLCTLQDFVWSYFGCFSLFHQQLFKLLSLRCSEIKNTRRRWFEAAMLIHQFKEILFRQAFLFHEFIDHRIHQLPVSIQDLLRTFVTRVDDLQRLWIKVLEKRIVFWSYHEIFQ